MLLTVRQTELNVFIVEFISFRMFVSQRSHLLKFLVICPIIWVYLNVPSMVRSKDVYMYRNSRFQNLTFCIKFAKVDVFVVPPSLIHNFVKNYQFFVVVVVAFRRLRWKRRWNNLEKVHWENWLWMHQQKASFILRVKITRRNERWGRGWNFLNNFKQFNVFFPVETFIELLKVTPPNIGVQCCGNW